MILRFCSTHFIFPHRVTYVPVLYQKPQWEEPAANPAPAKHLRKPKVKDEPVDEKPILGSRADTQWPPEASIVYSDTGDVKLTNQTETLQPIIRGAIKMQTKYLLWTDAYPALDTRAKLSRLWLYNSAKEKKAEIVKRRVKEDARFVHGLQDLVFPPFPDTFV